MDYIRQAVQIFDCNIMFPRPHPSYDVPLTLTPATARSLQPNAVFNGLSHECCKNPLGPTCLRSLDDIPDRLSMSCDLRQLVFDVTPPLWCEAKPVGCAMVKCTQEGLKQVVCTRMKHVRNWMLAQRPPWFLVDTYDRYLGVTEVWFQLGYRLQMRTGGHRPRRNVVNTLVFHPYHNAYRFDHTTFHKDRGTDKLMESLENIGWDTAYLCTTTALSSSGYHCWCDGRVPPALPLQFLSLAERDFIDREDVYDPSLA